MTHAYKISRLPKDYCKLAVAAWKALSDCELFEIEGKLVFTDDLDAFLKKENPECFCAYEFDSHAAFERWLLNAVADWCTNSELRPMLDALNRHLKLA